jgi:hypothetical protein
MLIKLSIIPGTNSLVCVEAIDWTNQVSNFKISNQFKSGNIYNNIVF